MHFLLIFTGLKAISNIVLASASTCSLNGINNAFAMPSLRLSSLEFLPDYEIKEVYKEVDDSIIRSFTILSDDKFVSSSDNDIKVWESSNSSPVKTYTNNHSDIVTVLVSLPDGR